MLCGLKMIAADVNSRRSRGVGRFQALTYLSLGGLVTKIPPWTILARSARLAGL